MRNIDEVTEQELFHIANIATGRYFLSQFASNKKEIETGNRRRRVEWTMDDEKYYFEISSDSLSDGWHWYSENIDKEDNKHIVHCLNPALIVDYCDENNLNIRNK